MTTDCKVISRILLAEDDEDDRDVFEYVVKREEASVRMDFVRNGMDLMDFLRNIIPDLLFLDLDMPYKNGLECLVELRSSAALQELPVIVFSSTTRSANIQTAYELGAHLFLIKSSALSEYSSALKAILNLDWSNPNAIREQYCLNGRYAAFS